ncbi:Hypothetical protein GLP15_2658 [Giardia lamblia P15]|uniref:Leucine-rich repeat protein n=1 Tax=Giardia intestinalis (strain P15) TaxID=658858 RepID=E1F4B1_GIAIA|nr:Hypothetical protein GLP15_2658 [Giardia lamblia P15]
MSLLMPPPLKRLLMSSDTTRTPITNSQFQSTADLTTGSSSSPLIRNGVLLVNDKFSTNYEMFEVVCKDVHTVVVEELTSNELECGKKILWILNSAVYSNTIKKLIVRASPRLLFYPFFTLSYELQHIESLLLHDVQLNIPENLILSYIDHTFPNLCKLSLKLTTASSCQFPINLIKGASLFHKLGTLSTCTTPAIIFSKLRSLEIDDCQWISSQLLFSIADCFPLLKELHFSHCSTPQSESLVGSQDARDTGVCSLSIMKLDVLEISLPLYNIEDLDALALMPRLTLMINRNARISGVGQDTVAQLLTAPVTNHNDLGVSCYVERVKESLRKLNNAHTLMLIDN